MVTTHNHNQNVLCTAHDRKNTHVHVTQCFVTCPTVFELKCDRNGQNSKSNCNWNKTIRYSHRYYSYILFARSIINNGQIIPIKSHLFSLERRLHLFDDAHFFAFKKNPQIQLPLYSFTSAIEHCMNIEQSQLNFFIWCTKSF